MKRTVLALLSLAVAVSCFAQDSTTREQQGCKHADDLRLQGNPGAALQEFLQVYTDDDSAIQQGPCKILAAAFPLDGFAHLFVAGSLLVDHGNLDRASTEYRQALSQGGLDSPEAYLLIGRMLSYFRMPDRALASFREAARRKPELVAAHTEIGNLLAQRGDARGAVAQYRLALKTEPDSALLHEKLGRVLVVNGDYDPARQEFVRARELDPGYADLVQKDLNQAQAWQQKTDQVVKDREEILRDPQAIGHYRAFSHSGEIAAERGDYDEAVADDRQALAMLHPESESDRLRTRIAYALWLKGDLTGAIAAYEPLQNSNGGDSACTFDLLLRENKDMVGPLLKDVSIAFSHNFASRSAAESGQQGGEGMVAVSSCPEESGLQWFQFPLVSTF